MRTTVASRKIALATGVIGCLGGVFGAIQPVIFAKSSLFADISNTELGIWYILFAVVTIITFAYSTFIAKSLYNPENQGIKHVKGEAKVASDKAAAEQDPKETAEELAAQAATKIQPLVRNRQALTAAVGSGKAKEDGQSDATAQQAAARAEAGKSVSRALEEGKARVAATIQRRVRGMQGRRQVGFMKKCQELPEDIIKYIFTFLGGGYYRYNLCFETSDYLNYYTKPKIKDDAEAEWVKYRCLSKGGEKTIQLNIIQNPIYVTLCEEYIDTDLIFTDKGHYQKFLLQDFIEEAVNIRNSRGKLTLSFDVTIHSASPLQDISFTSVSLEGNNLLITDPKQRAKSVTIYDFINQEEKRGFDIILEMKLEKWSSINEWHEEKKEKMTLPASAASHRAPKC